MKKLSHATQLLCFTISMLHSFQGKYMQLCRATQFQYLSNFLKSATQFMPICPTHLTPNYPLIWVFHPILWLAKAFSKICFKRTRPTSLEASYWTFLYICFFWVPKPSIHPFIVLRVYHLPSLCSNIITHAQFIVPCVIFMILDVLFIVLQVLFIVLILLLVFRYIRCITIS